MNKFTKTELDLMWRLVFDHKMALEAFRRKGEYLCQELYNKEHKLLNELLAKLVDAQRNEK